MSGFWRSLFGGAAAQPALTEDQATYRRALIIALLDGDYSDADRRKIEAIAARLNLPPAVEVQLFAEVAQEEARHAVLAALEDGRLYADEEAHLTRFFQQLGATVTFDDTITSMMNKARLLAKTASPDQPLPILDTRLMLAVGERVHFQADVTRLEIRTKTTRVNYSGPTVSIPIIKGVRWRMGSMAFSAMSKDELTPLDRGTLYLTGDRLLFAGVRQHTTIKYPAVVSFNVYTDGLSVAKGTGREQYFTGEADFEVAGAMLERLLTASRSM